MKAHYDTYDYPAYWEGREYEHECEVVTIKEFLDKISKIESTLDLGCGYGRLSPTYLFRSKKITLAEPSGKLLKRAEETLKENNLVSPRKFKNISFVQTKVEDLDKTFSKNQFDLVLMIRVMHHITDPEKTIESISRIIKPGGYFILEFANKIHGKALINNILQGNFTFPIDIFPISRKSKKEKNSIPFLNYHPHIIKYLLKSHGFKIKQVRSVSNIRNPFLKKHIPSSVLLSIEKMLQKPLAHVYFGPSVFILARKKG